MSTTARDRIRLKRGALAQGRSATRFGQRRFTAGTTVSVSVVVAGWRYVPDIRHRYGRSVAAATWTIGFDLARQPATDVFTDLRVTNGSLGACATQELGVDGRVNVIEAGAKF